MRSARIGGIGLVAVAVGAAMGCPLQVGGLAAGGSSGVGSGTRAVVAASSSASSSGTGGSMFCMPGTARSCYDGDAGAPDAGACRAGAQICNDEGTAYEVTCSGEILPMPDDCASGLNLICAVPAPVCTGTPSEVVTAGAQDADAGLGVAVDSMGNAIVTGFFHDSVDFGGTTLTTHDGGSDAFVAKYDPGGNLLWAVDLGGNGDDQGTAVALDASDDVYVTGWFSQSVTLTGGPVNGNGIYVAKLHGADGTVVWGDGYVGDSAQHQPSAIAVGMNGDVAVAGVSAGALLVTTQLTIETTGGGDDDGFLLALDGTGTPLWLKQVSDGNKGFQALYGVAIDEADAGIVVTGSVVGNVDFGGQTVTATGDADNVALARYTKDGAVVWAHVFGANGNLQHGYGVTLDATSAIYVVGDFQGQIRFGTTVAPISASPTLPGLFSLFVARFEPTMGAVVWADGFPGSLGSNGYGVAVDPYSVAVAGDFLGMFGDGATTLTTLGAQDALILKVASGSGDLLWARQLGGTAPGPQPGSASAQSVAFDPRQVQPLGSVVATGYFSQQLDNVDDPDAGPPDAGGDAGDAGDGGDAGGGGSLGPFPSDNGSNDIFVVRLDP